MCRFIETIRVEEGRLCAAERHNRRLNATRRRFFGEVGPLDVRDYLPGELPAGICRFRIVYGREVEEVSCVPYRMRAVGRLRLVDGGAVEYAFKYADRSALDALFARRDGCDEVLVVRDGLLTDTSIANVALFDGAVWRTPARPLLAGTRRARLLEDGLIVPDEIPVAGLSCFSEIVLFNAMIGFGELRLPVSAIDI